MCPHYLLKRTSLTLLAISFTAFAVAALASEWQREDVQNSLRPSIPVAKGTQCVEPTEIMRRQHMDFILHQRDKTVHQGVRTEKHRFVNCINCHVQPLEVVQGNIRAKVYPRHTSEQHFCTSCHTYALVSIDCFQCHADRPEEYYLQKVDAMPDRRPSAQTLISAIKQETLRD